MQALFNQICHALHLGEMTADPMQLTGGYSHRMYALQTTRGRFAVKLLNPEVMQRADAADNYARAEAFEALLEAERLPILPAKVIDGRKMHCVDGQYLYAFDYYGGRVLPDEAITAAHCAAMGAVLARIHALASREADGEPDGTIDWPPLVAALLRDPESRVHGAAMHRALPLLIRLTRTMVHAANRLPRRESLCHNDMDAKNVLWQGSDYRIIDLECLGYANAEQELMDLAISWAGYEPDEDRFKAFLNAYLAAGGRIAADPADLYDSRRNHLDWLAHNARRALSPDPAERSIGREQIDETLNKLQSDQRRRARILAWMQEVLAR